MLNVKNIVKGVSFLLCLGFLACATNAMAKANFADYEKKLQDSKTYGECSNAKNLIATGRACGAEEKQKALEAVCNV